MVMLDAIGGWKTLLFAGVALYLLSLFVPAIVHAAQRIQLAFVKDPVVGNIGPATPRAGQDPHDVRDLADRLEPIRRRYKVPALAAALIQEGRLTALGAVGVRRAGHAVRVSHDDCFHLGSCTKAMTSTLCALLVEQNKLRWSSTIAEVFPDLATDIGPEYRAVTLEHLLAHRSGFAEGFAFHTTLWPKICELKGPLDDQRRRLIKLVLQGNPSAPPGTKYQYSNCGYTIAGAMCEQVTGRLWEDLMRDLLFGPLGMTSAGFGPPGTPDQVDQPWGHQLGFWSGKWTPMPPEEKSDNPAVIGPAGRVHCSLPDWAKFATLHLRGPRGNGSFLSSDAFRLLHCAPLGGDYACGWSVADRDWAGGTALSHAGSNTMWFSVIWLAPNRNVAFLAATNLGTQMAFNACDSVIGNLLDLAGRVPEGRTIGCS
jgi:CubicO group peptidase (beta-lactamase class C family)